MRLDDLNLQTLQPTLDPKPSLQGLTMPKIIRSIPAHCLERSFLRSLSYFVFDVVLAALMVWAIVSVDSWLLGLPLSIVLGLTLGGLFVVAHDCGHRSFCNSERLNNFFGHLSSSLTMWPFHIWRQDHDLHHRHTDHIDQDPAWRPVTYRMWRKMPRVARFIYLQTRQKFFFMGSIYTTWQAFKSGLSCGKNPKLTQKQRREIRFSLVMAGLFGATQIVGSIWIGGLYGFVYLVLIPQLVFHAQLSTATLFHHTSPQNTFLDKKEWSMEKAQLAGSIHVSYPRWVEFFWHDINWHVPHHVCVGVPHYHLRQAHAALRKTYPELVKERVFGWELVRETTSKCHFVKSKLPSDLSWVSHAEAAETFAVRRPNMQSAQAQSSISS